MTNQKETNSNETNPEETNPKKIKSEGTNPEETNPEELRYQDIEFLVTSAHAIAGGVESPLQLAFQVQKIILNNVYVLASFKLIKVILLQKISSL